MRLAEAKVQQATVNTDRLKRLHASGAVGQEELNRVTDERVEAEARVQIARTGLEMAKLQLDFTRVRAPMDGRVGRRLLDVGGLAKADETHLIEIIASVQVT